MDLFLRNKSALVTGSSRGIGLAVAKSLAAEGCHIHLASRTESDLEAAASEIRDIFAVDVIHHVADLSRTQRSGLTRGQLQRCRYLSKQCRRHPTGWC